ncbi:MAG: dipeptidase [Phycisphaerales bacterium]|nr:dipeptidase [Phycisphaerales bacterium]
MSDTLDRVLDRVESNFDDSLERLMTLLRVPSVSTDPAHEDDVAGCARLAADLLADAGLEAKVHDTPGHPMVVATGGDPDGPHVLYYGHYDVQPADPVELWDTAPFEPTITGDGDERRVVCRGAADDKGQLMMFVEALRAWHETDGGPPIRVTVLLEGEEESGSPSLDGFLEQHREALAPDVCVVSDTGMWNRDTPAITTMLRGLVYLDVKLSGPGHDLHSGMYGGAVVNPLNELTRILGELHDADGRITVDGFYDGVREPAAAEQWRSLDFDEAAFLESAGLKSSTGESGRTVLERIWSRPTLDINGICGGYTGEGAKTVIAAEGRAKLSCRLVPGQDPQRIEAALIAHLQQRTPEGCSWEIHGHGCNPAIEVETNSPWLRAAVEALGSEFSNETVLCGCGGSIPVVGSFQSILGAQSLLVGFGLDDDRVHSPNEKFDLVCFHRGIRSHAAIVEALAGVGAPAR